MAEESHLQLIATKMMDSVKNTIKDVCNYSFTQDPESFERDVIDYDGKFRVLGLDKFDGLCFVGAINYYADQDASDKGKASGTIIAYLNDDFAEKLLIKMGVRVQENEDSETAIKEATGEFCKKIAEQFQKDITSLGYSNMVISAPLSGRNDIPDGVPFPHSQYAYQEINFFLFKKKSVVVCVTMEPA